MVNSTLFSGKIQMESADFGLTCEGTSKHFKKTVEARGTADYRVLGLLIDNVELTYVAYKRYKHVYKAAPRHAMNNKNFAHFYDHFKYPTGYEPGDAPRSTQRNTTFTGNSHLSDYCS
jgi:hypothetical protein